MSDAAEVSGIEWRSLHGALLLIAPKEATPAVETPHGTFPAVRADVAVLDGPRAGDDYQDILVLPRMLQNQVRPTIASGGMVLGRLVPGPARTGQKALWSLGSATEADKAAGRNFLARRGGR